MVRTITNSEAYWARAQGLIPAGTQTLSKGPTQYVDGVAPKYLARGSGCRVWDVDGNEYIDYPMALGPVILGHGYPAVDAAIVRQLKDGITFSLMHPLEVEVSELLRELVPMAEMVRFGKNGSDATAGAVRLARAYTGREKVAHCGYHGWMDWYIASTTRRKGVPKSAVEQQFGFKYNDLDSLRQLFEQHPGEIAAVIMEPYSTTMPLPGYLEGVKKLAHENGALLVFDEIVTGFRYHLGGIHQLFGVEPDLACFGKSIANGMPLSALVGRAKVMQEMEELFYSFTFGGETLSLAAAKATLGEMRDRPVIPHIASVGAQLQTGFLSRISAAGLGETVGCVGLPARPIATFKAAAGAPDLVVKSVFQQEAIKRGVLFSGSHCMTYSHQRSDVDETLAAYEAALAVLAKAIASGDPSKWLEGGAVRPVFRPVT